MVEPKGRKEYCPSETSGENGAYCMILCCTVAKDEFGLGRL
jgi:hypothetical protein